MHHHPNMDNYGSYDASSYGAPPPNMSLENQPQIVTNHYGTGMKSNMSYGNPPSAPEPEWEYPGNYHTYNHSNGSATTASYPRHMMMPNATNPLITKHNQMNSTPPDMMMTRVENGQQNNSIMMSTPPQQYIGDYNGYGSELNVTTTNGGSNLNPFLHGPMNNLTINQHQNEMGNHHKGSPITTACQQNQQQHAVVVRQLQEKLGAENGGGGEDEAMRRLMDPASNNGGHLHSSSNNHQSFHHQGAPNNNSGSHHNPHGVANSSVDNDNGGLCCSSLQVDQGEEGFVDTYWSHCRLPFLLALIVVLTVLLVSFSAALLYFKCKEWGSLRLLLDQFDAVLFLTTFSKI